MMRKRLVAVAIAVRKDIVFLYKTLIGKETDTIVRVVIVAMILYLLSPLDIIPDTFPIIGQIDDIAIILFGINWVKKSLEEKNKKSLYKNKEVINSEDIDAIKK